MKPDGTGRRAYLLGIGGAGVSGLARLFKADGWEVAGSDRAGSATLQELKEQGIETFRGHAPDQLRPDADLVVASAAVPSDNPILVRARERGIRVVKYAEALGMLFARRRGIAVSGTHGKTTTSALAAFLLREGSLDPTFLIGGQVRELGGNAGRGAGPHFVAEACEFDRSFLALKPSVAVVTNIEADHLDSYGSLDGVVEGFEAFLRNLRPGGRLVVEEDPRARLLAARLRIVPETTGLHEGNDWRAADVLWDERRFAFRLIERGRDHGTFALSLPGIHNVRNALAALAVAIGEGVEVEAAREALPRFRGVRRRFEILGAPAGVPVVSDYGHHPTEIRATIAAARSYFPGGRILLVFQPHQHCRTRWLFDDFVGALCLADEAIVPDIYSVRETEEERRAVSADDLVEAVARRGGRARRIAQPRALLQTLAGELGAGDVLLFMGAGDVGDLAVEAEQFLADNLVPVERGGKTARKSAAGAVPTLGDAAMKFLQGLAGSEEAGLNPI